MAQSSIWDSYTYNRIQKLHPYIKEKAVRFILQAQAQGMNLRITSAFRSMQEQQQLYNQGRVTVGPIVTNAKPGQSYHNYGLAFDVVEIKGGQAIWNNPRWSRIGELGKSFGLYWGGDWKWKDKPHFQSHSGPAEAAAHKVGFPDPAVKSGGTPAASILPSAEAPLKIAAMAATLGLLIGLLMIQKN